MTVVAEPAAHMPTLVAFGAGGALVLRRWWSARKKTALLVLNCEKAILETRAGVLKRRLRTSMADQGLVPLRAGGTVRALLLDESLACDATTLDGASGENAGEHDPVRCLSNPRGRIRSCAGGSNPGALPHDTADCQRHRCGRRSAGQIAGRSGGPDFRMPGFFASRGLAGASSPGIAPEQQFAETRRAEQAILVKSIPLPGTGEVGLGRTAC